MSYRFSPELVEFSLPLLRRIREPGDREFGRLAGSLVEEWRWVAGKPFFPTSELRESCRLFILEEALPESARLLFYRAAADAMLSVLKDTGPTPEARALGGRLDEILGGLDEDAATLLRLVCFHGLKAEDIGRMVPSCDIQAAVAVLADRLEGLEAALLSHFLVSKGHFTTRAEAVRDGKEDPRVAMGVLLPRLKQSAEQKLRREKTYISLTAEDMAATVYMSPPSKFPLNSLQALAYARKVFSHLLSDYFDRRQLRGTPEEFDERRHPQAASQEDGVFSRELRILVAEAIDEVSRRYRGNPTLPAFLYAHVRQEESLLRLARTYGLTEGTARNRVDEFNSIVRERIGNSGR